MGSGAWLPGFKSFHSSCATISKTLHFSEPPFSHLWNRNDNNNIWILGLLWQVPGIIKINYRWDLMSLLCKTLTATFQVQFGKRPVWPWVKPHFRGLLQKECPPAWPSGILLLKPAVYNVLQGFIVFTSAGNTCSFCIHALDFDTGFSSLGLGRAWQDCPGNPISPTLNSNRVVS